MYRFRMCKHNKYNLVRYSQTQKITGAGVCSPFIIQLSLKSFVMLLKHHEGLALLHLNASKEKLKEGL